ncbi:AAA family ATPase [Burkholderia ambifaria]|uniref:AAA family ATPase n=1 Tax=Burkholderia ambifaria TaxID=152480 RepID=UPI0015889B87|nr:AAA family ATPase [Burkholderia ambifaria]
MIHVRRNPFEPDFFRQYRERVFPEVKRIIDEGDESLYRISFHKDRFANIVREVRAILTDQFNSKCAYCETSLGVADTGVVDFFRPRHGVAVEKGKFLPTHYWAQGFEWRNLYLACAICSRSKRNSFPVEGERGEPHASYDELLKEKRLLIDPCFDFPSNDFVYLDDGLLLGVTEKGRATIETFNLNRLPLVDTRKRERMRFLRASEKERDELLRPDQPYLGLKQQLLDEQLRPILQESVRQAYIDQETLNHDRDRVSTDKGDGLDNYKARARYIEHVKLENIGPFPTLELDLTAGTSEYGPCFALLGNNGVGKSTVLRAIAITLGGKEYARRLKIRSNSFLSAGARQGRITVRVSGYSSDIVVEARRDKPLSFDSNDAKMLLLAYGSSRLVETSRHKARDGLLHAKIDNLFDPFLPIHNAKGWLSQVDQRTADEVHATLQSLIADGKSAKVLKAIDDRSLLFDFGDGSAWPLEELSDGYKSLLAMAVDIIQVMSMAGFESMESAQGVVIIDELGNHFHPTWKMRIVRALREAFPFVQFIYSTHEPLCLRGLKDGEIAVFERGDDASAHALVNLPSNSALYVDQLLTSEHFGLESTLDPQLQMDMSRYEELATMAHRSDVDETELESLEQSLTDAGHLGKSHRERIMLMVIDALLKAEKPSRTKGTIDIKALDEKTVALLTNVFAKLE